MSADLKITTRNIGKRYGKQRNDGKQGIMVNIELIEKRGVMVNKELMVNRDLMVNKGLMVNRVLMVNREFMLKIKV